MSRREATGLTTESQGLRGQLVATAAGYRHTREEHRRARPGSRARRHLEARLEQLSAQFERLLAEPSLDETVRAGWRRHLYHSGPEPETPAAGPASLPAHRPSRDRGRGSAPLWQR
jgi:hypothetical protein